MSDDTGTLPLWTGQESSESTLSAADFHARTSAQPGSGPGCSPGDGAGSGESSLGASTPSDLDMPSSRMSPGSSQGQITCLPAPAGPLAETSLNLKWTPPSWPETEPLKPGWYARLADGCWVTPQGDLCGRAGWAAYSETWPLSGTMRSGSVYLRPPLAPRTSDTGPSLLPIPVSYDATPGGPNNHYQGLGQMAKKNLWPIPTAIEGEPIKLVLRRTETPENCSSLAYQVNRHEKLYPTPCALDGRMFPKMTREEREEREEQVMLSHVVNSMESSGSPESSPGPIGQLNPMWVEWLMGFPLGWSDYAVSGTPSCPRSQNGSGDVSLSMQGGVADRWPTPRASDTGRSQWKTPEQAAASRFSTMLSSAVQGHRSCQDGPADKDGATNLDGEDQVKLFMTEDSSKES